MHLDYQNARSVGGVTVGNRYLRNNPGIVNPDGHQGKPDIEFENALNVEDIFDVERPRLRELEMRELDPYA